MNSRILTAWLLGFLLFLGALMVRSATLALMALPFLTYLVIGLLEAPSGMEVRLHAERTLDVTRTGEAATVQVRVTVRNDGAPIPTVTLSEMPQDGITGNGRFTQEAAVLRTGEMMELTYGFTVPRGLFRWKSICATVSDPLRLFERRIELPAAGEIVVQPCVRRFRSFSPNPERTLHSLGSILARNAGSGTDFWGVREYQPGDQMNRLDWRRAARNPRQFFTKELEQEEIVDIGFILDARLQSGLQVGTDSLFDHTLGAAVFLAETFLRRGNRAGLVLLGDTMSVVYPGYGKVQLNRILRVLAGARPGEGASHLSLDQVPLRMFSSRAMIVILSPLMSDEWRFFLRLRARANERLLISPDPVDFVKSNVADAAGMLGLRLARLERRLELRRVSQLGIRVIDWPVHKPLSPLVRCAFQSTRGRRG
jgi:uncharacterized protein (DUF58 family)